MTAVRPENAGGRPSYEDTGAFEAAVSQLGDPLSDPLPGHPSAPRPERAAQGQAGGWAGYGQSGYDPGYDPGYAEPYPQAVPRYQQPAPAAPQAFQPPPRTPMGPEPTPPLPEPQTARTAALPVVGDVGEDAAPPLGRAARRRAAQAGAPTETMTATPSPADPARDAVSAADDAAPVPGGRAARRQAAKHGGRRARAVPAAPAPQGGEGGTGRPMSRVEARRAARAAKESPAVVVSRVAGELFITLGVLMLLFVAYQLWWTNVLADEATSSAENRLQQQWNSGNQSDQRSPGAFSPGQGFAIIYIPKLDVKAPIAEGTDKDTILDKGMVGHYSGAQETAMPWNKTGNFALAGHRNTHGEPFRYINRLVPGDKVVVETSSTYYTYQVTSMLPQTSPSNIAVIDPIPAGSGFTQPGRYITLTTCTPEFTSTYRLIVWGKMVDEQPRSKGLPAALRQG